MCMLIKVNYNYQSKALWINKMSNLLFNLSHINIIWSNSTFFFIFIAPLIKNNKNLLLQTFKDTNSFFKIKSYKSDLFLNNLDLILDQFVYSFFSFIVKNRFNCLKKTGTISIIFFLVKDITLFDYLYPLFILCSVCIIFIIIINYIDNTSLKTTNKHIYAFLKRLLNILLLLTFMVLIGYFIFCLLNLFILLYKLLIKGLDSTLKEELKAKKTSFRSKPPKIPKDLNFSYYSDEKNKKNAEKRAQELKEQLLNFQNKGLSTLDNVDIPQSNGIKRNWNEEPISINRPAKWSVNKQRRELNKTYVFYKDQDLKFKTIIKNIDQGKENFYADESKSLFLQYIDLIKHLKNILLEQKRGLKK